MSYSWKLGRAFGIDIFLHWSFLLLPAWVLWSNLALGSGIAIYAVLLTLATFGCVVLHELGHALAARRFGIPTRDITLYPIGGVARLERMSDKPWEEFWIAVAGPAVNVLIAGVLWAFLFLNSLTASAFSFPLLGLQFLFHLMVVNIVLVVFNLIPAFPMDGGRVLRSLLALRLGQLQATQIAVGIGMGLAVLMGLLGAIYFQSPMLVLVAVFVYFAGQQELAAAYQQEVLRRTQSFVFPEDASPRRSSGSPRPGSASVYLWDSRVGGWVEQGPVRPVRRGYWGESD
jgi:Zn-dependent protease